MFTITEHLQQISMECQDLRNLFVFFCGLVLDEPGIALVSPPQQHLVLGMVAVYGIDDVVKVAAVTHGIECLPGFIYRTDDQNRIAQDPFQHGFRIICGRPLQQIAHEGYVGIAAGRMRR